MYSSQKSAATNYEHRMYTLKDSIYSHNQNFATKCLIAYQCGSYFLCLWTQQTPTQRSIQLNMTGAEISGNRSTNNRGATYMVSGLEMDLA